MIHILPESERHLHEESTTCQCEPAVRTDDEIIVIHNRINIYQSSEGIIDELDGELPDKPNKI